MNLQEGATTVACGLVLLAGRGAECSLSMATGMLGGSREGQRC